MRSPRGCYLGRAARGLCIRAAAPSDAGIIAKAGHSGCTRSGGLAPVARGARRWRFARGLEGEEAGLIGAVSDCACQ